jgi:phenylalanine ammonia-lyase
MLPLVSIQGLTTICPFLVSIKVLLLFLDNPLIDLEHKKILNGGNFQAMSVTNSMEKTRSALESIGKLSFAQAIELMNCSMSKGLPSCLAGDEPSTNYQ